MPPLFGMMRRHRLFIVLVALPLILFWLSSSSSSTPPRRVGTGGRTGGLGTNTWGDEQWSDDRLVMDELAPAGPVDWLKWKSKGGKRVLVTGGAGSLGRALIARLVEQKYTVHAADIVPRPIGLADQVAYHRIDVIGPAVTDLVAKEGYDGVIHFAAISLEQWCAPKPDECEKVNVGATEAVISAIDKAVAGPKSGTGLLSGITGKRTTPWFIYGSSVEVYGPTSAAITEGSAMNPDTVIGKTKLKAEAVVRALFERNGAAVGNMDTHYDDDLPAAGSSGSSSSSSLHGAILRFSDVYGYPRQTNVPAAFIPRLLQNAVSSLPIQFSSDTRPMDFLHADDAVAAVLRTMEHLEAAQASGEGTHLDTFNIAKGGKRWLAEEVVEVVRGTLNSQSPIRDIGDHKVSASLQGSGEFSNAHARSVLQWTPTIELPVGIVGATKRLADEMVSHTTSFINSHCPQFATVDQVPEIPEDTRNHDLYKLHNCTVNLGFNHAGWLHHMKCEDGKNCLANGTRVASYNWNASVWTIHVTDKSHRSNGRATVRFADEKGMGWLGLRTADIDDGGDVKWELFGDNDPVPHVDRFEIEVAPDSSSLRIMLPGKQAQQIKAVAHDEQTDFELASASATSDLPSYDMRMAVLCCQSEGDWPLLLDDHESADTRFGDSGQIAFNASRRLHLCDRAHASQKYFSDMAESLTKEAEDAEAGKPFTHALKRISPHPDSWTLKDMAPCWNDCNSPTVCMQTGSCRCVQADNCARRRENPLIALGRGIHPTSEKVASPLGSLGGFDKVLARMVDKIDWRDLLLPEGRDYLQAHPEFIKVHVVSGYDREQEIEAADCHNLQPSHCFSADSIMYKAMRHISVPADQADLIILPVYQHCEGADFVLHDVWSYASNTIPGINQGTKPVSLIMTHDWGICLAFTWEIWESRELTGEGKPRLYPDPLMRNAIVWSVMGDWDSRCYRPAQDVVVPARTCLSKKLVESFGDIENVRPARERPQLINWSGTFWGTGKSERLRLVCGRGGVVDEEILPGHGPQSFFPSSWDNYLVNLNNARFCPQPRGVAGWSFRVNDSIYAGCIPVLIAEGSHYPFASLLDWSQFSVRIHPTELDQIERILRDIPLERVEQMQANLLAVRDAFLYATDEHPEAELDRRGPLFFALHEAGLRLRTGYPDRHA